MKAWPQRGHDGLRIFSMMCVRTCAARTSSSRLASSAWSRATAAARTLIELVELLGRRVSKRFQPRPGQACLRSCPTGTAHNSAPHCVVARFLTNTAVPRFCLCPCSCVRTTHRSPLRTRKVTYLLICRLQTRFYAQTSPPGPPRQVRTPRLPAGGRCNQSKFMLAYSRAACGWRRAGGGCQGRGQRAVEGRG